MYKPGIRENATNVQPDENLPSGEAYRIDVEHYLKITIRINERKIDNDFNMNG